MKILDAAHTQIVKNNNLPSVKQGLFFQEISESKLQRFCLYDLVLIYSKSQ